MSSKLSAQVTFNTVELKESYLKPRHYFLRTHGYASQCVGNVFRLRSCRSAGDLVRVVRFGQFELFEGCMEWMFWHGALLSVEFV